MNCLDFLAVILFFVTLVIKFKEIQGEIGALPTSTSTHIVVPKEHEKPTLKSLLTPKKLNHPLSSKKTTPTVTIRALDTYV